MRLNSIKKLRVRRRRRATCAAAARTRRLRLPNREHHAAGSPLRARRAQANAWRAACRPSRAPWAPPARATSSCLTSTVTARRRGAAPRRARPRARALALTRALRAEFIDDEDEVLTALAEEIGALKDFVGGAEFVHTLLQPLETLSGVEEAIVRERVSAAARQQRARPECLRGGVLAVSAVHPRRGRHHAAAAHR